MTRRHERACPRHARRVHPAAPRHVVTDALAGTGGKREPRGARPAMKIDDEIESFGAQTARERDVILKSRQAAPAVGHEDAVDIRVVTDNRRGLRFDEIGDVSVRKPAPDRGDCGSSKDHVADEAQPNE